ncbi:MAG: hypothetical protein AB7H97_12840 [Pseudobdellovibrionaceae bacterium]
MGKCHPFSEIDIYLKQNGTPPGCLADTNFLIAISDRDHAFYEDAQFFFEKLVDYSIPIVVTVSARAEFIDYKRRVIVTENLMGMLAPSSKWKISAAVRSELMTQKGWIDNQGRGGNEPYLTDSRIKECKQTFLPKNHSGHIGWTEFCKEYLGGHLASSWDALVEQLDLNYLDMRADDAKDLFRKELHWDEMYRRCEETALGSQDAMILNVLDSSILPFVVTMDFDLAYGAIFSTKDKAALVPDGLYRNKLKKLKP